MPREAVQHKIEAHVAGLCFAKREGVWRCLIARRTPSRKLYPDLWECGGGQVHEGESFPDALKRQMREEYGIEVNELKVFGTYSIQHEDGVIPGVSFLCLLDKEPEVCLDPQEFVDYAWVALPDLDGYTFIHGVRADLCRGFAAIE